MFARGRDVLIVLPVVDRTAAEDKIKRRFQRLFTQELAYGLEYFSGERQTMIDEFVRAAQQCGGVVDETDERTTADERPAVDEATVEQPLVA